LSSSNELVKFTNKVFMFPSWRTEDLLAGIPFSEQTNELSRPSIRVFKKGKPIANWQIPDAKRRSSTGGGVWEFHWDQSAVTLLQIPTSMIFVVQDH
jgi:hypothetical protein